MLPLIKVLVAAVDLIGMLLKALKRKVRSMAFM